MKLDDVFQKYSLYKTSFAMPLDFTRFFISFLGHKLNQDSSRLKAIYNATNTIDYDLYIEIIEAILTLHKYILKLIPVSLSEDDIRMYNYLINLIYNNETLSADEIYALSELQIYILVDNGLFDVFQLSKPQPFVDEFDEEEAQG